MRGHQALERFSLGAFIFVILVGFFSYLNAAFSETIVRKGQDPCVRSIFIYIEIHTNTDLGEGALKDIAKEWANEIESVWNGPTKEQVEQAAEELGVSEADMESAVDGGNNALRDRLDKKAREMIEAAGGGEGNCAEVNCCKIYFHAVVQVRGKDDDPTEGFHQIEVMEQDFRSYVRREGGVHGHHSHATGQWGYDPKNPWDASAAHETGHLMGLDDKYHEGGGHEEGHDHDVMKGSYGWPHEGGIGEILKIGNAECDCCPRTTLSDASATGINMTIVFAMDALRGNNCELLKTALSALERELRNLQMTNVPMAEKMALATRLQERINQVKKALEDCPKETATTTGVIGEGVPLTYDSRVCVNYGGGTTSVPIGPGGIGIPTGPVSGPAGTPPVTPGTTPPTGPVTPLNPEEIDPGQIPPIPADFFGPGSEPFTGWTLTPYGFPRGTETPGVTIPVEIIKPGLTGITPIRPPEPEIDPGSPHTGPGPVPAPAISAPEPEIDPGSPHTGPGPVPAPVPQEEEELEVEIGAPPVMIVKAEQSVLEGDKTVTTPVQGAVLKLGYPPPPLPGTATRTAEATDDQHDKEPRHVVTNSDGFGMIFADGFESGDLSAWSLADKPKPQTTPGMPSPGETTLSAIPATGIKLDMTPTKSSIVYVASEPIGAVRVDPATGAEPGEPPTSTPAGGGAEPEETGETPEGGGGEADPVEALPETVQPFVIDKIKFGTTWGLTLNYQYHWEDEILNDLEGFEVEENHYRDKQEDDPYFKSKGSWGQGYDDQWAIKRAGFTDGKNSAWRAAGDELEPVVVAVIDTGLDWNHADISWDNIWQNAGEIPENGIDDDGNGYVDDVIGWDFYTNSSIPWDQDGHGTFIAGIIAAASDNGIGIRGINPAAKIMVLKALNDFGHTRASYLAKAIKYAADNGARIINLSVGGGSLTKLERLAVEYAHGKGAVIVVAAGNYGMETANYGLSPYPEVITVTSSDVADKRTIFSNWGPEVDVAAPGVDVLSLRARRTDLMRHILAVEYEPGTAYVGEDRRYYRASGTSFSAPIVAGLASLILSRNPELTNVEVKRMILHSARDIEVPGHDQYTGYGLVDAPAALKANPAFEITAGISGIVVVQQDGQTFVAVNGTAAADQFAKAEISIGAGEQPASFQPAGVVAAPVSDGILAMIPADAFRAAPVWTIRLVVTHKNGKTREQWYTLTLG